MPLDQKAINELKEIYRQESGEILSDQEAWDMGTNLVNLFKAICDYRHKLKVETGDNLTDCGRDE